MEYPITARAKYTALPYPSPNTTRITRTTAAVAAARFHHPPTRRPPTMLTTWTRRTGQTC